MIKKHFDLIIFGELADVANATELIMDAISMSDLVCFEIACEVEKCEVVKDDA